MGLIFHSKGPDKQFLWLGCDSSVSALEVIEGLVQLFHFLLGKCSQLGTKMIHLVRVVLRSKMPISLTDAHPPQGHEAPGDSVEFNGQRPDSVFSKGS